MVGPNPAALLAEGGEGDCPDVLQQEWKVQEQQGRCGGRDKDKGQLMFTWVGEICLMPRPVQR